MISLFIILKHYIIKICIKGADILKKIQLMSIIVLIITLIIMCVHWFMSPLTDWVIRIDGIIMMVSLLVVTYSTAKFKKDES